ncbi:PREDICTED: uncharacterized protein LOC105566738 [Vollenhovia emeryi]|uniref:uncharacterized protein LOC105566738 n=1 Tax=Vollenhovia emeryi TaxID=411798 RepID=UPI0005F549B1|nr:PREDICTED: uncharacterized protein LOC105566738 [Vollenhovia emeryi]
MHVDKVLLTIILCTTNVWSSDRTLTRNARTFDLSSFTWPQALFKHQPDVSIFPRLWPSGLQLREWTRNGITSLLRFVSTENEPMHIEFRPEDGPRAAKAYQRRFGYRGEWLINQLGNGLGPDIQLNRQPVLDVFLMPPPIPFSNSKMIRNSASALEYNR